MDKIEQVQKSLDAVDNPTEIYVHKEFFKGLSDEVRKSPRGNVISRPDNEPVVEKALGSTKKLGTFGEIDVFSHGKDPEKVYVVGDDRGWFLDGKVTKP